MFATISAGQTLLADRAPDSDALQTVRAARGAFANIRPMPNRVKYFPFDADLDRARNRVERFFNQIKHFGAVATRFDKRDDTYLASVPVVSIRIWSRT